MNFLSNRRQIVNVNCSCSDWSNVIISVPQRSVLGNLLLIAYMNDLYLTLSKVANIAIFADDINLHRSINTPESSSTLQSAGRMV